MYCLTCISSSMIKTLSSALLTSLFQSLDTYGWSPMEFVVATLKPAVSMKVNTLLKKGIEGMFRVLGSFVED